MEFKVPEVDQEEFPEALSPRPQGLCGEDSQISATGWKSDPAKIGLQ